ncbi:uncharacterized protein HGUI_00038 [Hanseniaspora guilliermondii]|uniref:Endoplasmic reticulum transmembrane protein n=1 Tax=Hanseniaspora guilliermondii TaxID=56406 RepID=A0A1L0FDZ7_9ASCO|nr:uncharacterized protein HGUI_00038 [Hanseniaspora guilliermondii]
MIMFLALIIPLPSKVTPLKKHFVRSLNYVAYTNETTKIVSRSVFVFIFLMFVDSIKKLQNISLTSNTYRNNELFANSLKNEYTGSQIEALNKNEYYREKFFAQRNMYLTGFTLFLCFLILRTIHITNELLDSLSIKRQHDATKDDINTDIAYLNEHEIKNKISEYEEKIDNLSKKILLEDENI